MSHWNSGPDKEEDLRHSDPPECDEEYCFNCGGEGWIENDCFEDTCCCADPELSHGYRPCEYCNRGGAL